MTTGGPVPAPWSEVLSGPIVAEVLARTAILRAPHPAGEVTSTQDVALALAGAGAPSGTIVVADRQRDGRGRSGRRWDDAPDGGSLAVTFLLDVPSSGAELVPHALGVAVVAAAAASGASMVRLKWPNDVVVRPDGADGRGPSRKLAGILVERERVGDRDVLLAGVGLNVDHRSSAPVADRTCLAALVGGRVGRAELLAALLAAVDGALVALGSRSDEVLARYRTACETIGRSVQVDLPGGERLIGHVERVDDEGRLVVRDGARSVTVLAGTVRDAGCDAPAGSGAGGGA